MLISVRMVCSMAEENFHKKVKCRRGPNPSQIVGVVSKECIGGRRNYAASQSVGLCRANMPPNVTVTKR